MVKITSNAPNLDHAKKKISLALFFENRILVQRKYLSYHLCHFVPFFGQPKTKINYFYFISIIHSTFLVSFFMMLHISYHL